MIKLDRTDDFVNNSDRPTGICVGSATGIKRMEIGLLGKLRHGTSFVCLIFIFLPYIFHTTKDDFTINGGSLQ